MSEFDPNLYYPPPVDEYAAQPAAAYPAYAPSKPAISTFVPTPQQQEEINGGAMTGTLPNQRGKVSAIGGSMDFFATGTISFNSPSTSASSRFGLSTLDGELPLLMELGVDFSMILEKTRSALLPFNTIDPALMSDGDIAGPFVFCLLLGFFLLFAGKLHFGYVFGFGVVGCWAIYMILNLVCSKSAIELHVVFSVLGYALLPIVLLAFVAVFVTLKQGGMLSLVLVPPSVLFSTFTATRFFEATLAAREQRYLIAYPVFLFFACFALITVF